MPDWSYRTLFQPLLRRLSPRLARQITLRSMGAVSHMPGGALLIKTLGHMEPSPLLESQAGNVKLGTPVGLSAEVDPEGLAQRALAQLGFGFVWMGPVAAEANQTKDRDSDAKRPILTQAPRILMNHGRETILYPDGPEKIEMAEAVRRIREAGHRLPIYARIVPSSGASPEQSAQQLVEVMRELGAAGAVGFAVDRMTPGWTGHFGDDLTVIERISAGLTETYHNGHSNTAGDAPAAVISQSTATACEKPALFWHLPADCPEGLAIELASALVRAAWTGVVIGPGYNGDSGDNGCLTAGPGQLDYALRLIRIIRQEAGPNFVIQAAAGIHEPIDALRALDAGASQLMLNSGFIYGGPGLPKRINDAILYEKVKRLAPPTKRGDEPSTAFDSQPRTKFERYNRLPPQSGFDPTASPRPKPDPFPPSPAEPSFWQNWGWMSLLGLGMMVGGFIAWMIAVTTVLLPYDEEFLGMTWKELRQLDPHLLHFMSHDRITLAGKMISIGILYFMLAKYGMRHGQHWARTAVLTSCLVGFPSFFLYLGYGYFDPLHAGAAIVLLPMFLLAMRRRGADRPSREPVNLRSDRLWRRAVWGQLCFVALGVALAIGGLTIAGVGITRVFVPSDLVYLDLTTEQLNAINPRLIPLIAHDRAGFGGALLADAAALLATALWGIQQGARWLWATLLLGGAPAFYSAISVHFSIGYVDTIHLLPAYFAVFLYAVGLILLYPYMMRKPEPYVSESAAASP